MVLRMLGMLARMRAPADRIGRVRDVVHAGRSLHVRRRDAGRIGLVLRLPMSRLGNWGCLIGNRGDASSSACRGAARLAEHLNSVARGRRRPAS
jgi:hypothetical protein